MKVLFTVLFFLLVFGALFAIIAFIFGSIVAYPNPLMIIESSTFCAVDFVISIIVAIACADDFSENVLGIK